MLRPLPEAWVAGILAQALAREIAGPELHEWLRRCTETLRLRAAASATTSDQAHGLCRELRDDFGFEAQAVIADELAGVTIAGSPRRSARDHRGTRSMRSRARRGAQETGDGDRAPSRLTVGEWALLLRRLVYAVVATTDFGKMPRNFFAEVAGAENLQVLVIGRDDLGAISDGAPTYVTQSVRRQLAGVPIRGRILPAARTISMRSAREIFVFIVHSNIEALGRMGS